MSGTYRIATANAAGFSHIGRRDNNEDAFCVLPTIGLFVVADGMGGYEGGEVAAKLVIDTLVDFFARAGGETPGDIGALLDQDLADRTAAEEHMDTALRLAHRAICDAAVGNLQEMGSTVAAVLLGENKALVAHVGDSRVYRIRDGEAVSLTRDHSVVADLQAAGCAGMLEHLPPQYSHMITRSLSSGADARPELEIVETRPGDTLILCSDGLHDVMAPSEIASLRTTEDSAATSSALSMSQSLCDAAFEAGGLDNITVVTVRL